MAETVGALIIAGIESAGVAGASALGSTVIGAGITVNAVVGTAALIGASIGLQYALNNPKVPRPEDGSQAIKQSVPSRIMGYGVNRLAGVYMLYESEGAPPATSYDVIAFHSGRISRIAGMLLNDDYIQTNIDVNSQATTTVLGTYPDERYSGDLIQIEARLGNPGQSALASFVADPLMSAKWNAAFVGNDIAYAGFKCGAPDAPADFTRIYPRGKPELSVVADCTPVFDPRDLSQTRVNPASWKDSRNPVIQLIDYLTRVDGGMGFDYDVAIAPNLSAWLAEANLCDQLIDKPGGGQEPRYRSDGWFRFDNSPEEIVNNILASCDGWLAENGDGSFSITVGVYRTPTDPPITAQHIFGFSLNYGQTDEELINQFDISFTDPTQKYVTVQIDPYRDEDSISDAGQVRAKPLTLGWVQSPSQAERLAERAMDRVNPLMTGSFTTSLYGLRYLGKRWVPLQYPFVSGLQDCVVEIQDAEVDLLAGRITWKFLRVIPDFIEPYTPAEEVDAPLVVPPSGYAREDTTPLTREDGSFYFREDA